MPPTRADYAKINIACKELHLDKYQLISDRYGHDSSKKLNGYQLRDLYKHFNSLGWKAKRKTNGRTSQVYKDSQRRKVVALWITLSKDGVVKNSSDQALQRYIKRMTGKDNLNWCDAHDSYRLIESLKSWALREGVDLDH